MRSEAVKALTTEDAATLITIARTDRDIGVRRIAIEKIDEAETLAEIAAAESERSLRDLAGERAAELWTARACGSDAEAAGAALGGIIKIGEQRALVDIVVRAALPAIKKRAMAELRDPRALFDLAKSDAPQDLRCLAVARIDDGDVLRALAIDTTTKEVGLAAVDRLEDLDRLENVAQKAKNKAVRQRARKVVAEIAEAQAEAKRAAKPTVPDEVKRRRAEKVQLLREVEAAAETYDFAKQVEIVRAAEAAWAQLAADDGDERFTKAATRFWKRKELHDSQTRSADELRTVEREAREQRARETAERDAAAKADADRKAAQSTDPAVIAEREAAAKADAERRAEHDAQRAAREAERVAKAKADADRAVELAASLRAMTDDMDKLAAGKDGRAIDRILAQSQKAFDQLGKLGAPDREPIAERYKAARAQLVIKQSELREAEDWARFGNVPKAEALIATAREILALEPAPADLGNRLKGLQELWKEVGPMPQKRSKELWEQFKAACDEVYEKVKGVRAVAEAQHAELAAGKEKLIAEAEALADSTDWAATAERLKQLQAEWKSSGHLPRKLGDELWHRFRAACDKFFERRQPLLDAAHEAEAANLAAKQHLVERAHAIADAAPGAGGWGKAIGEIKDLQRAWREIGFVPRRDADAIYAAFRTACDALFAKRDAARDGEANAHRDELHALHAEIAAVVAGGDDAVARAIAVRGKVMALDRLNPELTRAVAAMLQHVIATAGAALEGTELDPAAMKGKRDKLIAKAAALMPAADAAPAADGADVAAKLQAALRKNAFGDLRFSGRDPVEVIEELRTAWAEIGPILDDDARRQADKFAAVCGQVLAAVGHTEAASIPAPAAAPVAISVAVPAASPARVPVVSAAHDAITQPVVIPIATPVAGSGNEPQKTQPLPTDDVDTGWD